MPTNALELLELSAVRRGLDNGLVEERRPPQAPLDVLLQHLTTLACGPGFHPQRTLEAIRNTASYAELTDEEWQWCLRFLEHGGDCLGAYPRYRKLEHDEHGRYVVREKAIAAAHRLNMAPSLPRHHTGPLCSRRGAGSCGRDLHQPAEAEGCVLLCWKTAGVCELREMTAYVKASTRKSTAVPPGPAARCHCLIC